MIQYGRSNCIHRWHYTVGYSSNYGDLLVCGKCGAIASNNSGIKQYEISFDRLSLDSNINGKWKNPFIQGILVSHE